MSENNNPDILKVQRSVNSTSVDAQHENLKKKVEKLKAGIFLTFITAFGLFAGFGLSLSSTKKRETKHLTGEKLNHLYSLHDSGVELARRALARATLYSVGGFSIFCFTLWKLSGASTFEEFRNKVTWKIFSK